MELLSDGRNVVLILLGFGLLIFVHELGHFLAARWAGIRCESFAIGMGPVVAAWRRGIGVRAGSTDPATIARFGKPAVEMTDAELERNGIGETEWSLRILPLGGFVRMLGQEDLDPSKVSQERRSYQRAPVGKRMIVVSAGVVANLVLAIALFVVAFLAGVRFEAPVVGGVVPGSPASAAECADGGAPGLMAGDRVVTIDGVPAQTFADLQIASAMAKPGSPVELRVERTLPDGSSVRRTFRVTPRRDAGSGLLSMGIAPAASGTLGSAQRGEEALLAQVLAEAGLSSERTGDPEDALASVVGVQRPGTADAGAIVAPTPTYPDDAETRKVNTDGYLIFRSDKIFVSKALAGETLLLDPRDEERRFFDLYFLDFHIGTVDVLYSTTKDVTVRARVTDESGLIGDNQENG